MSDRSYAGGSFGGSKGLRENLRKSIRKSKRKSRKNLEELKEIIKRKLEEQRKDNYNMILPGVKGLIVSISSIVLYS